MTSALCGGMYSLVLITLKIGAEKKSPPCHKRRIARVYISTLWRKKIKPIAAIKQMMAITISDSVDLKALKSFNLGFAFCVLRNIPFSWISPSTLPRVIAQPKLKKLDMADKDSLVLKPRAFFRTQTNLQSPVIRRRVGIRISGILKGMNP